ncbi:cytochrome P450 [Mycena olivaceomarginata]|nr:cytochrome P450 [Mycena olivaceomarginata]
MTFIANAYTSQGVVAIAVTIGYMSRALSRERTRTSSVASWILDAWSFFTRRHDFLADTFRRSRKKFFRFRILQASNSTSGKHRVLASSGLDARKAFLTEKCLSLGEGYKILLGGGPDLADINVETGGLDEEAHFVRQLLSLTTKDRLQDVPVFPSFVNDIYKVMAAWGSAGSIDPFTEIYKLVFQMTVRVATCRELADDPGAVSSLSNLYWLLEKGTTPVGVLLPWFPSPARKAREKATAGLFGMLYTYVELRRNAAVPSSDAFDVLISQGTPTEAIVGFVLRTIFAGVINTGMNASWALLYTSMNTEWKAKATAEIRALLSKHSASNTDALHTRLASIPLAAWEDELPALDAVIRETLRLVMGGVVLRRSLAPGELAVGAETLAPGDFLAYPLADVHLDPAIYPDPLRFDLG